MAAIHGGRFWLEIGDDLSRLSTVVRADVLDAWFQPAPSVIEALCEHRLEMCRTSPEAAGEPLRSSISLARGIAEESILTGGGSSALMFQALPLLARDCSSALVLDPMYGEYRHVLTSLCGLEIQTLPLHRDASYRLDPARLLEFAGDLVVVVNPNSPTGQHVARHEMAPVIGELAESKVVWIDETYIEYAGNGESLETLAATNPNVVVCKSMSKVYALSGLRVAYLVSHPDRIAELARYRPPWAVSLPAQVCGALALGAEAYYAGRYAETARLRGELRRGLETLGFGVWEGCINSLLVEVPQGMRASEICDASAATGVYLRDPSSMWVGNAPQAIRISVRGADECARILACLSRFLEPGPAVVGTR